MTELRRFGGAGLALCTLVAVGLLWWWTQPATVAPAGADAIFRFEKEDLVGFEVVRPDSTLAFDKVGDRWTTVGRDWRPSASMVRRVAHQLHDLSARARVVDQAEDPDRYGLGEGSIEVRLTLVDGRTLAFEVGDPNPTSVSWYMRPLPDGPVFVVKKAAVDYYRLELEAFREDRVAFFDAADCEAIESFVDGRELDFRRVDATHWAMSAPESWAADRDRVRRILGSVASARASRFVEDKPTDMAVYGLEEGANRVVLHLSSGEPITLRLGDSIPGADPPAIYAWRAEDDAVYALRAALLQPFAEPLEAYRDPRVVGRHGEELTALVATRGEQVVRVFRSADGWRWEDGAAIPGATPRRVAAAAADLRARAFLEEEPPHSGLAAPSSVVELAFEDADSIAIDIGQSWEVTLEGRAERRQFARIQGSDQVVEVDGQLSEVLDDLFREHGRKRDRDAERRPGAP